LIAVVQMASSAGEISQNLKTIMDMAAEAAEAGAQMVVFPEMALSGYSHRLADTLALSINDPAIKLLSKTAVDLKANLLVGFAERAEDGNKPYISQLIAFSDGNVAVYRKVHLGRSEQNWFTAGTEFPVFSSHGLKFAVGICWDWHFPEMAAIYSLKGAEVLFAPHASLSISGDRHELWHQYMGARAYDNSVYLAACNLCGTDDMGREYSGGSVVWGPKGDLLAHSLEQTPGILYTRLSAERLNHLRTRERKSMKDSFFLADRKKELYHELLELEVECESGHE